MWFGRLCSTVENDVVGLVADEVSGLGTVVGSGPHVSVSGLGTVAAQMLASRAFVETIEQDGVRLMNTGLADSADELLEDPAWHMAVCFSPWKEQVARVVPTLTPGAQLTGSVDTLIRTSDDTVGINTTGLAAAATLRKYYGSEPPEVVVLLGTGPSARTVAGAVRRLWGDAVDLTFGARSTDAGRRAADVFKGTALSPDEVARLNLPSASILVQATSWGETAASEESGFAFDLTAVVSQFRMFIDLNVRRSRLSENALDAGVAVLSGVAMRRYNNECRAVLAKLLAFGEPTSAQECA